MTTSRMARRDTFSLDRDSPVAIYRQIYERVRAAISAGHLRAGERLPSARALAAQLGTARGTVDAAYAMLAGEGWIAARRSAGTVVATQLADAARVRRSTAIRAQAEASPPAGPPRLFRMGLPALDAFPRKLWSRLVAREARALSPARMAYPDPAGYRPLREAIAGYLAIARGIACAPHQVFVTSGYLGALGLIVRAVLEPGDTVWFEDPGYHLARQALAASGARLVAVPVDQEGLCIDAGIALARRARFAVVTPAHQSPLGVALSLPRRLALLSFAEQSGALVIEDDYDGEFHYVGRPLPAMKSLDRAGVVLYAGSFSKVLFPALRLGYLVVPDRLVAKFAAACPALQDGNAALEQAVVATFMIDGHFARHLKRMRDLYAARRAAFAAALADAFGDRLHVALQAGGMHLLARPRAGISDQHLVRLAERHGLAPGALSAMAVEHDCGAALLLGFTNIAEDRAPQAARALWEAIGARLERQRGPGPSS